MSADSALQLGTTKIQLATHQVTIPALAFLLMLAGVLLPSAMYSMNLHNPTPAELLVAICIALFSSVVFLWILDATSILKFRSEWVGRSIYGAAIASVLGTSVAVYADAFQARKYMFEGPWHIDVIGGEQTPNFSHSVLLMFSERSGAYWGYSDYQSAGDSKRIVWLQIVDFSPQGSTARINIKLVDAMGQEKLLSESLSAERKGKLFTLTTKEGLKMRLARPN